MDDIKKTQGQDAYNLWREFLSPPGFFDGIVSVCLQELRRKPIRMHLCDTAKGRRVLLDQLINKIYDYLVIERKFKVKNFGDVCRYMPKINLKLKKSDLSEEFADL